MVSCQPYNQVVQMFFTYMVCLNASYLFKR